MHLLESSLVMLFCNMSNEELLSEFELTVAAYTVNSDNEETDTSKMEMYLEDLKAEILKRMK